MYWNEVYPQLGETHQRLAIEKELFYAARWPTVHYGQDLERMGEYAKGMKVEVLTQSDYDTNPPEKDERIMAEKLSKIRSKKQDIVPVGRT